MADQPEYGYIVLIREHDEWSADWDGEVHPTLEAGRAALSEAGSAGWDAVLAELHPEADRG